MHLFKITVDRNTYKAVHLEFGNIPVLVRCILVNILEYSNTGILIITVAQKWPCMKP